MRLVNWLSETMAIEIMCERVGLNKRVGQKIWFNAKLIALRHGQYTDMVAVAQAIKFASLPENICRIKPEFMGSNDYGIYRN